MVWNIWASNTTGSAPYSSSLSPSTALADALDAVHAAAVASASSKDRGLRAV